MVNKILELVDDLKQNIALFKGNINLRKGALNRMSIGIESECPQSTQSINYSSPAVPMKSRLKKRILTKSNKRSTSKNLNRTAETACTKDQNDPIKAEIAEVIKRLDLQEQNSPEAYVRLIDDLKGQVISGFDGEIYDLKSFEDINSKMETHLWILKDVFYKCNKELRKSLDQGYDEEYAKEILELEALEAYKSSKEVSTVFQREINWLKQQNSKLLTSHKELNCK